MSGVRRDIGRVCGQFGGREGLDLAARVEAAAGPDRELDMLVWANHTGRTLVERDGYWWASSERGQSMVVMLSGRPDSVRDFVGQYTASLDAAMSLAPTDDVRTAIFWQIGNDGEGGDPAAYKARILRCTDLTSKQFVGVSATAPLALTAACLRARGAA